MRYDETGRPLVDETGRPLDWEPSYDSQRANYLPYQIERFGLQIGDPGTVTLYGDLAAQDGNRVSVTPGEGLTPFAAYDPAAAGFVQPLEGWQRFWDQIFSGNGIQEEYVPPSAYGAKGMDTTNFDWAKNLSPFAKDFNIGNAMYVQKERTPWYKDANVLLPAGIIGAGLGGLLASGYGAGGGAAGAAAGSGAVDDALGTFLIESGELPAASAYGQAVTAGTPNWAIPGVSGAGGELGYSGAVGGAVNDPLGAWLIEQGYPMDPQYAAQVTAGTQNWAAQPSIWDKAKDLLEKKPSLPPGTGSAQATGAGDGEDEQMNIWSDTATPKAFGAVQPYQPTYLNLQQAAFPFEAELQRRLALIRGAQ